MNLHPNWKALATLDFEHRIFVKEQNYNEFEASKKTQTEKSNALSGEEAKQFYLEVLSTTNKSSDFLKCTPIQNGTSFTVNEVNKIEFDERLKNKFLLAAQENDVETLKNIIDCCPKILNATDNYGWTALMCAIQSSSVESIKFLLSCKPNTKVTDKLGRNALSLATKSKYLLKLIEDNSNFKKTKKNDICLFSPEQFCDTCKLNFKCDMKEHQTSTIHFFNSNKNFKMKTYYGIPENNKGYQLMLKKGWNKDVGLGPKGCGCKYPVKTVHKLNRYGIGIEADVPRVTHKPNMETRQELLKRHNKIEKEHRKNISKREKNVEIFLRRELS